MEQRIVDINPIYEEICRLEKLATDRYLDSPGNNPATIRYAAQSNERQRLKHLIEKVPTIDPIHATGACYCRECKYRFTDDCAIFYESSQGQFQHIMEDNVFVATAKGESKMKQKLIDCEKTIEAIRLLAEKHHMNGEIEMANGVLKAITRVEAQPAIDPIHAMGACYCRECKHWKRIQHENGECLATSRGVITIKKDTGFCDCGERREPNE